jgi:hypothetical protein
LGRHGWGLAPGGAAGEVPQDWGRATTAREATIAAARTDGGGSGGGANNGKGNGVVLSAVPSLARATTSWRRGGRRCLGIVGRPTLTGAMPSRRRGGLQCLAIVGYSFLAGATTSRRWGGRQCLGIVSRSLARLCDGGGKGQTTVARFCTVGDGGRTKVTRHCCAMAVVARLMIVPLDSWPSLSCSRMARMEAAQTDGRGSGGGAIDGGAMARHGSNGVFSQQGFCPSLI